MTRILHTLMTICCLVQHTAAQAPYGNEWIDYGRPYLRIPIAETGIYEVTGADLALYGFPVDSIRSSSWQLFRQGKEIAVETAGPADGLFGREGRLRFYGLRNDGTGDTALYTSPTAMPHEYYGLYTDTTAYFLTWRTDSVAGLRMQNAPAYAVTDTVRTHVEEILLLFTSHYLPGAFYPAAAGFDNGSVLTAYDEGEGWTGPEIPENLSREFVFDIQNPVPGRNIEIELMLAGWSAGKHALTLWTGPKDAPKRKLAIADFTGRRPLRITATARANDVDTSGKLVLTVAATGSGGHASVSYARIRYALESRFPDGAMQMIYRFGHNAGALFRPDGMAVTDSYFDVSDPNRPRRLLLDRRGIMLAGAVKVAGVRQALGIPPCRMVVFEKMSRETDYLVMTHPLMRIPVNGRDAVEEYTRYRRSPAGGSFVPSVLYSHEVFDQFNGGQPGPLGIMNAIRWLKDHARLRFVLLAGRSVDPQKARKMPEAWQTDMVPNAGWPGSDVALATPRYSKGFCPLAAVGRINAPTSTHLLTYLEKVKAMEAESSTAVWRKQILHISGGRSPDELTVFKSYLRSFARKLTGSSLGANVVTRSKLTDDPVERVAVDDIINHGTALVTLFGHSAPDMTDVDIGLASDPARNYRNGPRFPAVIVNGCAVGSIFYSAKTISSDWIFSEGNGAVLFLAHTFNGPSTALKRYTEIFYEVLADSQWVSKPFGMIQQEAIRRNMLRSPLMPDSITAQQMTLHGDPAIRIFPATRPDYAIGPESVLLLKHVQTRDSTVLALIVRNNGRFRKGTLRIDFTRSRNGEEVSRITLDRPAPPVADTIFYSIPNTGTVAEQWLFQIHPHTHGDEENTVNNLLTIQREDVFQMPETDKVPPVLDVRIDGRVITSGECVSATPYFEIRIVDSSVPDTPGDTAMTAIWIRKQCEGCTEMRVGLGNAAGSLVQKGVYQVAFKLPFKLTPGRYTLTIQCRDPAGNDAAPYQIAFTVSDVPGIIEASASPNPSDHTFRFRISLNGPIERDYRLIITNAGGTTVLEKPLKCHTGINEWYWSPGPLATGTYHYEITADDPPGTTSSRHPEVLRGHLLYLH